MPAAFFLPSSCAVSAYMSKRSMERREMATARILAASCLLLLWQAVGHGATRAAADPLESAKEAIRIKEYSRAATELERAAAKGNLEAQYLLGTFALNALLGERDVAKARFWLEKAANGGHARAAYSLAALLATADPVEEQAARQWLAKAQSLGLDAAKQTQAREALPLEFRPGIDLVDAHAKRDAFWLAASEGNGTVLRSLLASVNVNERDEFGRGALARAALTGQPEALDLLLRAGATSNMADVHGDTPLMLAALSGNPRAVDVLLK